MVIVRIRRCSVCGKLTPLYVWGDAPAEREEAKVEEETLIDEEELLRRRIEESKYTKP